jgi:hypothetical protein
MSATERTTMSYEFDGQVLVIEAADGTVYRFDFSLVPEELDGKFMELGRKTKLANFAASAKAEGKDRIEMIEEGWQQLLAGTWESERAGGGPTVSAEIEALAKIKRTTVGAIQKALKAFDKEKRAKILSNPQVKAEAEKIKEARAAATVDLGDME